MMCMLAMRPKLTLISTQAPSGPWLRDVSVHSAKRGLPVFTFSGGRLILDGSVEFLQEFAWS